MRVRFKYRNNVFVTIIETVFYDEIEEELQFYEQGSSDPDYCVEISQFDAVLKIGKLLDDGI